MSQLILEDLVESVELDTAVMTHIQGGLDATINNSQQANQNIAGSFGTTIAFNAPISAPSTVLTEANPTTLVSLNTISLAGAAQNTINAIGLKGF